MRTSSVGIHPTAHLVHLVCAVAELLMHVQVDSVLKADNDVDIYLTFEYMD